MGTVAHDRANLKAAFDSYVAKKKTAGTDHRSNPEAVAAGLEWKAAMAAWDRDHPGVNNDLDKTALTKKSP